MTAYHQDDWLTVWQGDCREVMAQMPAESVHTVVTSPPYWGLRDYGTATWIGGAEGCDHVPPIRPRSERPNPTGAGIGNSDYPGQAPKYVKTCGKCGAVRQDSQLGLEPTPEEYVANMVAVFREVRRVLRADGTCWVNLGDSYAQSANTGGTSSIQGSAKRVGAMNGHTRPIPDGLKPKDLVGIPWRVAFALQADGWVLRSDVVWSKPNPMPESVTDRPTKAHEMLFLLSKARWIGPERGQFADISDEDARWLALFLDTEGNIVIKRARREADGRTQYGAQLAFANTHRGLLERAQAIVGKGSIHERAGTNAPMFYWQMAGREARDLLYRLAPFLIVKQRQARVAIHMQDVVAEPGKKRPGRYRTADHEAFLERCWLTVKDLNHFGDPDLSWVPELRYGKWGPERYYYDADAVREPSNGLWNSAAGFSGNGKRAAGTGYDLAALNQFNGTGTHDDEDKSGRNLRSVWTIATQPYPGAHFATFPEKLVEPCVKAGTSERGVCPECGAPWRREVLRELEATRGRVGAHRGEGPRQDVTGLDAGTAWDHSGGVYGRYRVETTGWQPSCAHAAEPVPATVLDPFAGSGTTGRVAQRLGRRAVLIDLSGEYLVQAMNRNTEIPLGLETA